MEAGAPDDVRDIEYPPVLEDWQPILNTDDAWHSLDAGRNKVLWLRAHERFPSVQHLCADLAAYRRLHSQNSVEHHSQHQSDKQKARGQTVDAKRHVSGVRARKPRLVSGDHIECDFCS